MDAANLTNPAVLELASRIDLVAHDDFAVSFPKGTPCRVIMDQGDGTQSRTVLHPLGDVANPMSREQVTDKFRRIALVSVNPDWQQDILAAVNGLLDQGFAPLFSALAEPKS